MLWKAFFLLLASSSTHAQQILVDDLELTTELGSYGSPTDIEFSPDGILWACNKRGILLAALPDAYDSPKEVLNIQSILCDNGERGLLAVTPHYQFGVDNPYVWVVYNHNKHNGCAEDKDTGPVIRLSRFTCNAGGDLMCDFDSQVVYLETPPFEFDHHNAGDVHFGMDGLLYMSIGDGGNSDDAQELWNLFGTMVRLSPNNTIPVDNPYSVESGETDSVRCGFNEGVAGNRNRKCQEIFSHGFRNPFRFSMNPNKGKTEYYVNDVGASLWEEISIGGDGYSGANYGWPMKEGPCIKGSDCDVCGDDHGYVEPEHFYHHDVENEGCVTAGTFVPEGIWPEAYSGKYIYGDFIFGKMYILEYHGNGNRTACPATSNYDDVQIVDFPASDMVAMSFGPHDDALYFLTRGFGGRLNRIRFTGELNRAPQPKIVASKLSGEAGTVISFDATQSTDPDGHALSYEWDFDGDGFVDSTLPVDTFVYNTVGTYEVTLKVRDGHGGRPSTSINIGIGEAAFAEILVPPAGAEFFVGEEFILTGSAVGPGITNEDESMTWEVKQHHGTHFHPFLEPTIGNRHRLQPAPSPEDFLAATNSYLEIILTVKNDLGIETTVSRNVLPTVVNVTVNSVPPGRVVRVDEFEVTTPATFISWANHPLELNALDADFRTWSNGGTQAQVVMLPQFISADSIEFMAIFGDTVAPSPMPTPNPPTTKPTPGPTAEPTAAPTPGPTVEPTTIASAAAAANTLVASLAAVIVALFMMTCH